MTDTNKVYRKNPSIISKIIGEEFILVPIREDIGDLAGKIYILKGTGVRIWELLNGKRTVLDIKDIILKEFNVKSDEVENDIISFLRQLEDKKLVVWQNKGGICDEEKRKKQC